MDKKIMFFMMALLAGVSLFGASVSSVANGNWTSGSTWSTGSVPLAGDDVTIHHQVILNTTITITGTLTVSHGASLMKSGNSQDIVTSTGSTFWNDGKVSCRNLDLSGLLYNYHSGLVPDSFMVSNGADIRGGGTIQNEGHFIVPTLTISAGGSIYNLVPIGTFFISNKLDNSGLVDNDWIISVSGNLINNTGTLTGNGGTYYCDPTFTNNSGALVTCTGLPINICRPDGSDPIVNGSGTVNYPCALLCNGPWPQPQPVVIESFMNENTPVVIKLLWRTASESNMKEFVVEKATSVSDENCKVGVCGSYLEFAEIGRVAANGNKPGDYSFVDKNPVKGVQYYRLKSLFTSGEENDYSHVLRVIFEEEGTSLTVFPNPSMDKLSIHITGAKNVEARLSMYAIDGRKVWEGKTPMSDGSEDFAIRVCDFAAGAYIVTMEQGTQKLSRKVIFTK